MNVNKKRLDGITIFRFIAAFYVFVFHVDMRIPVEMHPFVKGVIGNGAIGMSFFFVLSGFILTYNYNKGVSDNYYRKRIARIFPAYIFCGLITLPILLIGTESDTMGIIKSLTSVLLYSTATQAWFYPAFSQWQFGGTWSVSVEMFFYALFPLLLGISNTKNLNKLAIIAFIATSSIIPVSLLYTDGLMFTVYYATPIFRLPEFVMGIVAAKYMMNGVRFGHVSFFISVCVILFLSTINNIGFMQYNVILVPCICVILIYLSNIKSRAILKPLIHLGEISYSFYLMQVAGFMILDHIHPDIIYKAGIIGWVAMFVIFTLMAQLSYSLFEKRNSFAKLKCIFVR